MKNQLSIRLPQDLRDWLETKAFLTGNSLNAIVVDALTKLFEADPLDSLTIRRFGPRFVIRSSSSGRNFGPYRTKEQALQDAVTVLGINGILASNVTDETDQPNLVRGELTPKGLGSSSPEPQAIELGGVRSMPRNRVGRVQKAIIAAFDANPSRRYTIRELAAAAYPNGPLARARLDHTSRAVSALMVPLGLRKDRRALPHGRLGWQNVYMRQAAFDVLLDHARRERRSTKPTNVVKLSAQRKPDDAA